MGDNTEVGRRYLFLCTGNYYRSRFAEEYVNWHSRTMGTNLRAESAGLARNIGPTRNPGPISPNSLAAFKRYGIEAPIESIERYPRSLEVTSLDRYDLIIVLDKDEHEPMVQSHIPDYQKYPIIYWNIKDVQDSLPESAIAKLKECLDDLLSKD